MGNIKTSKLDNGMISLEITYGGPDFSFGGVDTSAPPMYIDPHCFTDSCNFHIVNEQLVATCWCSAGITITDWTGSYLGSGSLYTNGQYYNWVLSFSSSGASGTPPSITLTYYIWLWPAGFTGSVTMTASVTDTQTQQTAPATPATAQIIVDPNFQVTSLLPNNVTFNLTVDGSTLSFIYYNSASSSTPNTPTTLASAMVSAINTTSGFPSTAVLGGDGLTITLTTTATGTAANVTTLSTSTPSGGSYTGKGVPVISYFAGGAEAVVENFGIPIQPLSWTTVGEELFLGGAGSMILRFSYRNGFPVFQVLTDYLGAITLNKFNGQLIAAGVIPGPGQVIQDSEMVIGWSAGGGQFGVWNPVNGIGEVTGAGFAQEADISDYITGSYILNSILVILRTQGVDYMTALTSSSIPFEFNHISNALKGEGCHDSRLVTQYDQIGMFVGNTDIYEFSGSLAPIGKKVKNTLISFSRIVPGARAAVSGSYPLFADANAFTIFDIAGKLFTYCLTNKTWMLTYITYDPDFDAGAFYLTNWAMTAAPAPKVQFKCTFLPILTTVERNVIGPGSHPTFWKLLPFVQDSDFQRAQSSYVVFSQEEVMFGRDITIDSVLISVKGTPGQVLNWSVSGILHSTLTLPAAASSAYVTMQVFFTEQVTTVRNPQLRLDVPLSTAGVQNSLSFSKVVMFGSFDPNQRPT